MEEKKSPSDYKHIVANFYLDTVTLNYVLYEKHYDKDKKKDIYSFRGYFSQLAQLLSHLKQIVCHRKITTSTWQELISELEKINYLIHNHKIFDISLEREETK